MNKRGSNLKPRHILLILVIVCVLMLILSSVSSSINNVFRGGFNTILMPMQEGLNKVGTVISNRFERLAHLEEVEDENEALKEEVDYLRAQNTEYQLELTELSNYKGLLNMKDQYPDYETIGAHVIGENSTNWNRTVLIDVGSNDGIEVNMNVIAQGGLVGIVTSVSPFSATVRTIVDQDCQVGAMSADTKDTCIVRGDIEMYQKGLLYLEKIDKDSSITDSKKIVTSDKSSIYLPGLLIGYSDEIKFDDNDLTKSGFVKPIVDFTHLDSVLVIKNLKENGN